MKTKFIRMKMETYLYFRRMLRAKRGESASDYFDRLSKFLEEQNDRN